MKMNRESKFRGKNKSWNQYSKKDEGEWVYGNLLKLDSKGYQTYILEFMDYASSLPLGTLIHLNMNSVDIETVGQFTGLPDKNGKEIYEGDIIKATKKGQSKIGFIIFKDGGYWWEFEKEKYAFLNELIRTCEVVLIGNIHDNKDLLNEVGV